MTLARRFAEHFVAPTAGDRASTARPTPRRGDQMQRRRNAPHDVRVGTPPGAVLLAAPADAPALGAALGLALARECGAPVALVCVWAADQARPQRRAPALPAASRLAASLTARGHEARGTGRLVVVRLAAPGDDAAAEAGRAIAAAGAAPTVLALAAPRTPAFDDLLSTQDLVVVAVPRGSDPALARLAVAGLGRAVACEVPRTDAARALAAAGLTLLPSARRALAEPVAALT